MIINEVGVNTPVIVHSPLSKGMAHQSGMSLWKKTFTAPSEDVHSTALFVFGRKKRKTQDWVEVYFKQMLPDLAENMKPTWWVQMVTK